MAWSIAESRAPCQQSVSRGDRNVQTKEKKKRKRKRKRKKSKKKKSETIITTITTLPFFFFFFSTIPPTTIHIASLFGGNRRLQSQSLKSQNLTYLASVICCVRWKFFFFSSFFFFFSQILSPNQTNDHHERFGVGKEKTHVYVIR